MHIVEFPTVAARMQLQRMRLHYVSAADWTAAAAPRLVPACTSWAHLPRAEVLASRLLLLLLLLQEKMQVLGGNGAPVRQYSQGRPVPVDAGRGAGAPAAAAALVPGVVALVT